MSRPLSETAPWYYADARVLQQFQRVVEIGFPLILLRKHQEQPFSFLVKFEECEVGRRIVRGRYFKWRTFSFYLLRQCATQDNNLYVLFAQLLLNLTLTLASSTNLCGKSSLGKAYMAPCTSLQWIPGIALKAWVIILARSASEVKTAFFSDMKDS